jgi:hypothetical protein
MRNSKFLSVGFCLLAVLMISSCGGGGSTPGMGAQSAGVFTIATDSPTLPSIVSAQVSLASITLSDGRIPHRLRIFSPILRRWSILRSSTACIAWWT